MLGLPSEFTPDFLARLEQLRIKTRREYAGMGKGAHLSPKRGSSLEFSDYRHYSPGDDFRYIDWGLYGRTDKLYIKLFKEEEDLLTYIFLDASASMAYPAADRKFESAVAMALSLAYVALASGDRVMIRLLAGDGERLASGFVYGRHRIVELARRLNAVRPAGRLDLLPALARELVSIKRAGKVFGAAAMDVTAVQILGGLEISGQGIEGNVELVDAETGEHVRVAMGTRSRQQYRETLLRLSREIKTFCFKRGLHYTLYTTDRGFHDFFIRAATELGLVH
jgi:hypothetical protein